MTIPTVFVRVRAWLGISIFSNVVRVLKHGKAIPDSRCTLLGIDNFTLRAVEANLLILLILSAVLGLLSLL